MLTRSLIKTRSCLVASLLQTRYKQRNRCFMPIVYCQINRILIKSWQLQLLNAKSKRHGGSGIVAAKSHLSRSVYSWHHRCAIRIDKRNPDSFLSLFHAFETQLNRQRALRVGHRHFPRAQAIERAEDVQLACGINRSRIAQRKNFNFHCSCVVAGASLAPLSVDYIFLDRMTMSNGELIFDSTSTLRL